MDGASDIDLAFESQNRPEHPAALPEVWNRMEITMRGDRPQLTDVAKREEPKALIYDQEFEELIHDASDIYALTVERLNELGKLVILDKVLEGQRFVPRGVEAKVLYVFMHPSSTLQLLPMPTEMARAGLHVLCAGSRYQRNDTALIMEKVLLDLGAYIRHAKEVWGYRKVVLHWITSAKKPETRARRIEKFVAMLARGEKIVTSVPRSRCSLSCAFSTLSRS